MDYILFGAGTGASLAVIGWILREWGPRLRDGKSDDDIIYSASELIDRMSWARFCASCGMAMVVAGTLILLATAIVTAWNPGDQLAGRILIGMYVFVSLLMLVWSYLYTRQFGTSGIYRPMAVDPVSDTREAVAVTERENSGSPSEVPTEEDADVPPTVDSPAEPQPDFAEVAASRGGLGRFASFFNRQRPVEATNDDGNEPHDEQVEIAKEEQTEQELQDRLQVQDDETIIETDQPGEAGQERAEIQESEVIAETDDEVVELIDEVKGEESEEAADITPETVVIEAETSVPEDGAESAEPQVEPATGDASTAATIDEPPPAATPEDDALAELRRRRLERLSGGNQ